VKTKELIEQAVLKLAAAKGALTEGRHADAGILIFEATALNQLAIKQLENFVARLPRWKKGHFECGEGKNEQAPGSADAEGSAR